jgi:hypothetical protein
MVPRFRSVKFAHIATSEVKFEGAERSLAITENAHADLEYRPQSRQRSVLVPFSDMRIDNAANLV